jgi:hypothetical protein
MHVACAVPNRGARSARRRSHLPVAAVSTFARNALGPTRNVIDADGTFWQVCEVEYALDRRTGRSLVFESDTSVRRVRRYPDTWFDLPDAELVRLVEST